MSNNPGAMAAALKAKKEAEEAEAAKKLAAEKAKKEAAEKAAAETSPGTPAALKAKKEARAHVLVHNTTEQLFHLTIQNEGGDPRAGLVLHDQHTLLPGVNRVKSSVWAGAKAQTMTRRHLDVGDLVELDDKPLEALPERSALKMVGETVAMPLLLEWQRAEKRSKVKKAIKEQLAKIAPTAGDEDDDTDTEEDAE